MYHMIVKRRLTSVFERLGKGDYAHQLSLVEIQYRAYLIRLKKVELILACSILEA
jgi:hypothetical protein